MDFKAFKSLANDYGFKIGMMDKAVFKMVSADIDDTETVEYIGTGMQGKANAAIVLTEKYVYLAARMPAGTDSTVTTIKRDNVSGVSSGGGPLFGSVKIDAQGSEYVIDKMNKDEASKLRKILS